MQIYTKEAKIVLAKRKKVQKQCDFFTFCKVFRENYAEK